MSRTPITPGARSLRQGLLVLVTLLVALVVVRAVLAPQRAAPAVVVVALLLLATSLLGARSMAAPSGGRGSELWLGALVLEWAVLVWLTPEAAYLLFPLCFVLLHVLGARVGALAIGAATLAVVVSLGVHSGWSIGGVVGPFVGAGVALLIGVGYRALAREAEQREELVRELLRTQELLAVTEHESGVLAERSRLAREIHDTLAQGLSSIQMLLHAAERADPERPGIEHVRLARETAAANLADARRFVRELSPPELEDEGLGGALRRLAERWESQGLAVSVRVAEVPDLPMHWQTALLRISQGAIANVIQHAGASAASITLEKRADGVRFAIRDDGRGFDVQPDGGAPARTTDSFGLRATRERVAQLGGVLTLESAPGRGTTLIVDLATAEPA